MKYFVLLLFFFLISCSGITKNCEIRPDIERIGESVVKNQSDLSQTELRAAKASCNF